MTITQTNDLNGARIWLSGSIPKLDNAQEAERIRGFVALLARTAFARGGVIVHGSHPTIRDILLDEARRFQKDTGKKARLLLVISALYVLHKDQPNETAPEVEDKVKVTEATLGEWNTVCAERVLETPLGEPDLRVGGKRLLRSLTLMRLALARQTDLIVAVGGKWWSGDPKSGGIPEEIEAARDFRLPLFLLGGMGGATGNYLKERPELLSICQNGLSEQENRKLSELENTTELVNRVIDQIAILRSSQRVAEGTADFLESIPAGASAQARGSGASRPRRILCLDGGGIRGVFTASVLAAWETMTGKEIADHFDLIVGTSTGGILAIALGMGLKPADLVKFYDKQGPIIFPSESGLKGRWLQIQHWFAAKHDRQNLRNALEAAFATAPVKSSKLADSQKRLAITAYETRTDFPVLFRTPHSKVGQLTKEMDRIEVAMATSAAPTYFDPTELEYLKAVDGGIWANSPTSIALAEAVDLGWDLANVSVLSVGTTFTPNLLGQPFQFDKNAFQMLLRPLVGAWPAWAASLFFKPVPIQGKLGWMANIADLLMKTQGQTAELVTKTILGSERYTRVDAATIEMRLDDAGKVPDLITHGNRVAAEYLAKVERDFLNGIPADPWP